MAGICIDSPFVRKLSRYCGGSMALAWVVALNAAVSLLLMVAVLLCSLFHVSIQWIYAGFLLPSNPVDVLCRPWAFVSYMFVQLNPIHLICNLIWLFWFGILMSEIRPRSIWPLYLGGGFAGAVAFLLAGLGTDAGMWLAGSSASALALMSAAAVIAPQREMRFFLIGDVKLKWIAPVCILLCFIGGVGNAGVLWSHVGGVLYGVLYAVAFIPMLDKRKKGIWHGNRSAEQAQERKRNVGCFQPPRRAAESMSCAATGRLADAGRLDELLDKIRLSGYASLTQTERRELEALSRRLKK